MAHPHAQAIDVYSYFTDRFYGVKDPRAIIPRDRPPSTEKDIESEETEAEEDVETPSRLEPEGEASGPPGVFEQQPTEPGIGTEQSSGTESKSTETSEEMKSPEESSEQSREEEENPFGDILQSDSEKEKKQRYSTHPIPQESSSSSK